MQKIIFNEIEQLDFRTRESIKALRTNLEFAGRDVKAITVTSCTSNEGKSSISFQLACSIAESGKSVVLVDADLRKSVLRNYFRSETARYGLSHYLSGQLPLDEVLCAANIENFHVIFSGPVPPNPSELLGGESFRVMMEYLKTKFDYIIVDTPPLGSVIDSAVAAGSCDGTVIVIESGAISYRFAQSVKNQLEKVNCRILGVILNKVNMETNGYYGKYYGRYYGSDYGGPVSEESEGGLGAAVVSDTSENGSYPEEQDWNLAEGEKEGKEFRPLQENKRRKGVNQKK